MDNRMVQMVKEIFEAKAKIQSDASFGFPFQISAAEAYENAAALMVEILEGNYEALREIHAANLCAAGFDFED